MRADGTHWIGWDAIFRGSDPKDHAHGALRIAVRDDRDRTGVVDVPVGAHRATVQLAPASSVVVKVVGMPAPGAEGFPRLELQHYRDWDPASSSEPTGWSWFGGERRADGTWEFNGLIAGGHYGACVVARHMAPLVTERFQAEPGTTRLVMRVPPHQDVVVLAERFVAPTWLRLVPSDGRAGDQGRAAVVDEHGRAVFPAVPDGHYRLESSELIEPLDVSVPCGDVVVDAAPANALRVAILDENGSAFAAGLRAGDLVIGFDGEPLPSIQRWTFAVEFGAAPVPERIDVRRAGAELSIDFADMDAGRGWRERAGAAFTPTRIEE